MEWDGPASGVSVVMVYLRKPRSPQKPSDTATPPWLTDRFAFQLLADGDCPSVSVFEKLLFLS